jgi:arsenate reductase
VNYYNEPLTSDKLRSLIAKTGLEPWDVLRRHEAVAKDLDLSPDTDPERLIELMIQHPGLLQRPIVEVGDRAVVARPIERALELIQE